MHWGEHANTQKKAGENKRRQTADLQPSCSEVTAPNTAPSCHPPFYHFTLDKVVNQLIIPPTIISGCAWKK